MSERQYDVDVEQGTVRTFAHALAFLPHGLLYLSPNRALAVKSQQADFKSMATLGGGG